MEGVSVAAALPRALRSNGAAQIRIGNVGLFAARWCGCMARWRAMGGAAVCAGVHAFSVCAESHFQILFGLRQQDRTMNRELQRSADDRRLGGGMGLVAGPASSPMATRKRNFRSRRRRALGWTAKRGPVAGPSESPLATRPGSSSRRAGPSRWPRYWPWAGRSCTMMET